MTAPSASAATRRRILVADDEPHIGRIIKMKLENGPFEVQLAFDGREALDALRAEPTSFDLVLLELSGIDVLSAMRSELHSETPAIILTAAGQDEQERDALAHGANAFVTKPFSPKKLYALVARLTGVQEGDEA